MVFSIMYIFYFPDFMDTRILHHHVIESKKVTCGLKKNVRILGIEGPVCSIIYRK